MAKVVKIVSDSIIVILFYSIRFYSVLFGSILFYLVLFYSVLFYSNYSPILLEGCCITRWYKTLDGEVRVFGNQMRDDSVKVQSSRGLWDVHFLFLLNYSRKVVNITGNDYCLCFRFNVQLRLIRRRFLRTARSWRTVLIAVGRGKGTNLFVKV